MHIISGVARPMKLVGHRYIKWSLKQTTPTNRCPLSASIHDDLGWKVASEIVNLTTLTFLSYNKGSHVRMEDWKIYLYVQLF